MPDNDLEIIRRCLGGDREAFAMIVDRYQTGILYLCWSVLRDHEDARDVTQEAFTQAYLHLDRFDPARCFRTWLHAIAYRRCIDRKRKAGNRSRLLKRWVGETLANARRSSSGPLPGEGGRFEPLLRRLNRKERIALGLKVREGYSAAEIAQILGCAESTARVHVFSARRRLRKWIKAEMPDAVEEIRKEKASNERD